MAAVFEQGRADLSLSLQRREPHRLHFQQPFLLEQLVHAGTFNALGDLFALDFPLVSCSALREGSEANGG